MKLSCPYPQPLPWKRVAPLIFESGYIAVPRDMAARAYRCTRGWVQIVWGRRADLRNKNYHQHIPTTQNYEPEKNVNKLHQHNRRSKLTSSVNLYYCTFKCKISIPSQVGNNARSSIAWPAKRSTARPSSAAENPFAFIWKRDNNAWLPLRCRDYFHPFKSPLFSRIFEDYVKLHIVFQRDLLHCPFLEHLRSIHN